MPFSFPANPSIGALSTQNSREYRYAGNNTWELVAASGSGADQLLRSIFVPPAPTGVTAAPGSAQVSLSWAAPTGVIAQAPITDYSVQFSSTGGPPWMGSFLTGSTSTSQVVAGLTNGTPYTFRVAAVNGVGTGVYSAVTSAVTPVAVTQDPYFSNVALLLSMDGTGDVFVDSSPVPKNLNSVNVTQSTTQARFGGKSAYFDGASYLVSSSSSAFSVAGVPFAIEFWLYPLSLSSTLRSILHLHTGSPRGIHISYNNRTLQVDNGLEAGLSVSNALTQTEWQHVAVARSGGDGATLEVYVNGTRVGSYTSQDFGATSTPLIGWYYDMASTSRANAYIDDLRITVGSNRLYTGATIPAPAAAFPTSGPMSAPTSLAATSGNAQLSLSWTAPSYNGGSAITGYSVEYTPSGGSPQTVSTGSTSTSYTLTGLTNGTAYTVKVAGVNAGGTGTFTAASSSVTPSAASLTVSPSSGTADNGTAYSWSGSGTAVDPLQTSDAAAPSGIGWGFGYGGNTYRVWQFTCGVSGTLTFEFGGRENDGAEIPNFVRYIRNGSVSTAFSAGQTFFGSYGARRTLSVTAGDVIKLSLSTGSSPPSSTDWTPDPQLSQGKFRLWIS
jgi:hypothetical protein